MSLGILPCFPGLSVPVYKILMIISILTGLFLRLSEVTHAKHFIQGLLITITITLTITIPGAALPVPYSIVPRSTSSVMSGTRGGLSQSICFHSALVIQVAGPGRSFPCFSLKQALFCEGKWDVEARGGQGERILSLLHLRDWMKCSSFRRRIKKQHDLFYFDD